MRTLTKEEYEEAVQQHMDAYFEGKQIMIGGCPFCRVFVCRLCPVREPCKNYRRFEFPSIFYLDEKQAELFALEAIYDYGVANGLVKEEKP